MLNQVVQIRLSKVSEAAAIEEVIHTAYEQYKGKIEPPLQAFSVRADEIRREIRSRRRGYLVAVIGERVVGTLRYRCMRSRGRRVLLLSRLAVDPQCRHLGIGRQLMQEGEKLALRLGVRELRGHVRVALSSLLDYYQSLGYRSLGRRSKPGYPRYLVMIGKSLGDHK